jgi:hypothetical protein
MHHGVALPPGRGRCYNGFYLSGQEVYVSSVLEIVELKNGDIVLQPADGEDSPMVTIRFSDEAAEHMPFMKLEVAKAMIQAGIQAFAELTEQADQAVMDSGDMIQNTVLH